MSQSGARHARHQEPMPQPPPEILRALQASEQPPVVPPIQHTYTYPQCRVEIQEGLGGQLGMMIIYPPVGPAEQVVVVPMDAAYARRLAARLVQVCGGQDPAETPFTVVGPDGQPITADE